MTTDLATECRQIWCCEFELSADGDVMGVTTMTPDQREVRVLVRLHGDPLGYLDLDRTNGPIAVTDLVTAAWRRYGDRIRDHLAAEGLTAEPGRRPPRVTRDCPNEIVPVEDVSVIVCTRDRGEALRGCLTRLAAITYPRVEFVIVDNAPTDDTTRQIVRAFAGWDSRFRYACEPRPGLSRARNRGLSEARGSIVAYTDDDVSVDPRWVHGVVKGMRRTANVACVTGLVATATVSNDAEAYFDARAASWSSRCEPQVYDLGEHRRPDPLYPYSAGIFGTGANFAFDRDMLRRMGGFDEALGAGTLTRGGEDLEIFVRVLRAGRAIVYEPAAVVWHHHRADTRALLNQMYAYGTGLTAFLTKLLSQRATRRDILSRVPAGLGRMLRIGRQTTVRLDGRASAPRGATLRELAGYAAGPVLYLRARSAVRELAR